MKNRILAIIPARGGSKGIPRKNIKLLDGKPLIAYTIEAAKKSQLITDLIVSTDDPEIAQIAKDWGADVPFLRPEEISGDNVPMIEVVKHGLNFMEAKDDVQFDYSVTLQPTSPFRLVEDIDKTLQLLIDTTADSAVTVVEVETGYHPIKMKKMEGPKIIPCFMEEPEGMLRQDYPKIYKRSSAVYAQKRDLIIKQNRFYGDYVVGHIVPQDRSIDIDNQFDWLKAEHMLHTLKEKGYQF